ncbi:MAG: phosphonate C-P lyase system protein PhnL [Gammaproteobacteria bacterium]|nr:phosphonate C-P lyase system protein PhnL [Gammaproteobacteria bacterium]MCP5425047.1 phosphonate C-P lyase system protein PhnL [Gammaproteobacteria bacterium]MCP5459750.1 phosphonate C-P lyase system protein PhnL [Gammaproteobacteria bacterium]
MPEPLISVRGLNKSFTLHNQGGVVLPVLRNIDCDVYPGECVALQGVSGAGKSTLLRSLYANYKPQAGQIRVRHGAGWVDMVVAEAREILAVRRHTLGYVSQFLRAVPRVPAVDVVAEPLRLQGVSASQASQRAERMLARLRIPQRLWSLAPSTFSGGEQQRVNIARGFVVDYPVLLLDEPTAALDSANRLIVVDLIQEAKARGAAVVGIFHDQAVRDAVASRIFEVERCESAV